MVLSPVTGGRGPTPPPLAARRLLACLWPALNFAFGPGCGRPPPSPAGVCGQPPTVALRRAVEAFTRTVDAVLDRIAGLHSALVQRPGPGPTKRMAPPPPGPALLGEAK